LRSGDGCGEDEMKIEFDQVADAIYIRLKDGEVFDTKDVSTGIFVDVDEFDEPLGIEILNASKRFAMQDLTRFTVDLLQSPLATA
jgi:uncharacterized protein YuzE